MIKQIKVGNTNHDIVGISEMITPTISNGTYSGSIKPNVYYKIHDVKSATITLATPTNTSCFNHYMFEIKFSGGSTLTLPAGLTWANGDDISGYLETGKTFQISIINNLAVFAKF